MFQTLKQLKILTVAQIKVSCKKWTQNIQLCPSGNPEWTNMWDNCQDWDFPETVVKFWTVTSAHLMEVAANALTCLSSLPCDQPRPSYTPIIHDHHTRPSYTPIIHAHHTRPSYTPILHDHHTRPSYTTILHAHHTRPFYTTIIHAHLTRPSYTPIIHAHFTRPSYTTIIHDHHTRPSYMSHFIIMRPARPSTKQNPSQSCCCIVRSDQLWRIGLRTPQNETNKGFILILAPIVLQTRECWNTMY